ncbi:TolC family protein [Desulfosporosinus sp. SYSU MS00001]|uniref:TolC family protein n=1 Tax=Desulfosporosinus sp. SYSU MS00001 TaxID=3416284 RepID=UPI003CEC1E16
MKKSYLALIALVVSASLMVSTHNTLALENAAQPTSSNSSAGAITTTSNASSNTTTSTAAENPSQQSDSSTQPADTTTLNLSLEDALKDIETGNTSLKLADSELQIYDKQNQQALARHTNATVSDEDSRKDRDLNYKRSQWTLDNAKHDRDNLLKTLKVQVTNEYETILTYQQQADSLKTQLANLDKMIEQANLRIKLGLDIPASINTYNANKSKLEAAQKMALDNVSNSMISLKNDLGIDLDRNVVLTSSLIPYTKFDDSDVNNLIAKAIQNDYDVQKYQQDIDISQIEYNIDFYYDDTQSADQVQLSIEDKKSTLTDLPKTKLVQLRTDYNTLITKEYKIEADKLAVQADQVNIDVMQKNIDAGKSSSADILTLQDTLLNDQVTLQQDINDYMAAVGNYQVSLDD